MLSVACDIYNGKQISDAIMKIHVPQNYRCPLCPDHEDSVFEWSDLLHAPICEGCTYDIHSAFMSQEDPETIETNSIKKILGLSFRECKLLYLQEQTEFIEYEKYQEEKWLSKHLSREDRIKQLQIQIERYEADTSRLKEELLR